MKKFFISVAIATMCVFNVVSQTMVKDTLVLVKNTQGKVTVEPVSTGHYVVISSKRGSELVYRSAKKNAKTGHYSYFVIRTNDKGEQGRVYLTKDQKAAFIEQFGEK